MLLICLLLGGKFSRRLHSFAGLWPSQVLLGRSARLDIPMEVVWKLLAYANGVEEDVEEPADNAPAKPNWSSGLCSCFTDLRSCAAGFCCLPIVVGQLTARLVTKRKNACRIVTVLMAVGIPILIIDKLNYKSEKALAKAGLDANPTWVVLIDWAATVLLFMFLYLMWKIRAVIRKRDGMNQAGAFDCCFSIPCPCCTLTQTMRHEKLMGAQYKLVSEDGVTDMASMV